MYGYVSVRGGGGGVFGTRCTFLNNSSYQVPVLHP